MISWEPTIAVLPITMGLLLVLLLHRTWLQQTGHSLAAAIAYPWLPAALQQAPKSWRQSLLPLIPYLRYSTLVLIYVAMLAPVYLQPDPTIVQEGIAMMLVLDTSGSMQALDMEPSLPLAERQHRLGIAKAMLSHFINGRPNDSIGLVIFGTGARTICPLTKDHQLLKQLLDRIHYGELGENTAIGTGLGLASKRLLASDAQSKTIVLITDGSNNAGTIAPKQAAALAKSLGITVHTIGLGTSGQVPFFEQGPYGKQIHYMLSEMDEKALEQLAQVSGGKAFRATDQQALTYIGQTIDTLERSNLPEIPKTIAYPMHHWPLAMALACCILEWLLRFSKGMLVAP